MVIELRRMWYMLDTNEIHIRPRYIRSAASISADTLSRELDTKQGLAAQPSPLHLPSSAVGAPLYRPLRFHAEHTATALQR
jgi:hypothetical protein